MTQRFVRGWRKRWCRDSYPPESDRDHKSRPLCLADRRIQTSKRASKPPIGNKCSASFIEQYVAGLEIAVNDSMFSVDP